MKILFYDECPDPEAKFFNDKMFAEFRRTGNEVEQYKFSESARKKVVSRHFQMYEELLDYAEMNGFDLIHHNYFLAVPEYLLSELKARPKYGPKISFMFSFREINRSLARALTLKELIDMPQIHKGVLVSMFNEKETRYPANFVIAGFNRSKVKIIHTLLEQGYDSVEQSLCDFTKSYTSHKKFTISYFGRWDFVKGVDIFVESLKHIDLDIDVIINSPKADFSKTKFPRKVIIDNTKYPFGEFYKFMNKVDLVVCPHRKLYEFGPTGMTNMAHLAHKPLVVPDFYFFNEIVQKTNTGLVYEPEDPLSMAFTILKARANYKDLMKNANWNLALKDFHRTEFLVEAYIGE